MLLLQQVHLRAALPRYGTAANECSVDRWSDQWRDREDERRAPGLCSSARIGPMRSLTRRTARSGGSFAGTSHQLHTNWCPMLLRMLSPTYRGDGLSLHGGAAQRLFGTSTVCRGCTARSATATLFLRRCSGGYRSVVSMCWHTTQEYGGATVASRNGEQKTAARNRVHQQPGEASCKVGDLVSRMLLPSSMPPKWERQWGSNVANQTQSRAGRTGARTSHSLATARVVVVAIMVVVLVQLLMLLL